MVNMLSLTVAVGSDMVHVPVMVTMKMDDGRTPAC